MSLFKLLSLIILLASGTIFFLQNQQPLSLKLFCSDPQGFCFYQTPELPIAGWVLIAVFAGVLTSFLLQLLNSSPKSIAGDDSLRSSRFNTSRDRSYETNSTTSRKPQRERYPEMDSPRSQRNYSNTTTIGAKESDWEGGDRDEWNIEEPPQEPTFSRDKVERSLKEEEAKDYEVPQQPQNVNRSGSVYSYKYREARNSNVDKITDKVELDREIDKNNRAKNTETITDRTKEVYDANYRLITPPYQPTKGEDKKNNDNQDNEEDWI